MALPEPFNDPVIQAALVLVIAAIVQYQRTLSWTEYRAIHGVKRRFFPLLDRYWPHFVHEKGGRDDAEYITTREQSVKAVFKQLTSDRGSPHLVSSIKRLPDGRLSAAHVVWRHADGTQTEAYLFARPDGKTDVYAHHETGVSDPEAHLSDPQTDGDPRGVVRMALGMEVQADE